MPKRYKPNPSLRNWVEHNRSNYKAGKLTPKRKERLESIGFNVSLKAAKNECTQGVQKRGIKRVLASSASITQGSVNAPKKSKMKASISGLDGGVRKKTASPPSLEDASQAYRTAYTNAEDEDEQPPKKRRKTTKSYDASSFSIAHVDFKNNVLAMLLAGGPVRKGLRAAFLDDFAEDGVTLRTTQKLLETGRFAPRDLYCANPNHEVVEALRRVGVNAKPGVFIEAAQVWAREDADLKFDLAYVDLCTGSADEVQKNLEAVLPSMAETSVLAYTITGRAGSDKVPEGEHDHTWHMMGSRMQRILRSVERDPHNFELLGTLPGRKLGEVKEASEIFFSEGARGARVCTVLFKRGSDRAEMLV